MVKKAKKSVSSAMAQASKALKQKSSVAGLAMEERGLIERKLKQNSSKKKKKVTSRKAKRKK